MTFEYILSVLEERKTNNMPCTPYPTWDFVISGVIEHNESCNKYPNLYDKPAHAASVARIFNIPEPEAKEQS